MKRQYVMPLILILLALILVPGSACKESSIPVSQPENKTQNPPIVPDIITAPTKQDLQISEPPKDLTPNTQSSPPSAQIAPLTLSGVRAQVTYEFVTIEWDTDEPATSQVSYKILEGDCRQFALAAAYDNCLKVFKSSKPRVTDLDNNLTLHHIVVLRDFRSIYSEITSSYNPSTAKYESMVVEQMTPASIKGEYGFTIASRSESGREIVSGEYKFTYIKELTYVYDNSVKADSSPTKKVIPLLDLMSPQAKKLISEGDAYMDKYDYTSAIKSYETCIAIEPNNSIVWCRKGDALSKQAQGSLFIIQKAVDCYQEALDIDGHNYKAMYGLADALARIVVGRADDGELNQMRRRAKILEERYRGQY